MNSSGIWIALYEFCKSSNCQQLSPCQLEPLLVGQVYARNYKDFYSADFISRGLKQLPTTLLVTELDKCMREDPEFIIYLSAVILACANPNTVG